MVTKGEKIRDWIQFFVLIGSILGALYVFYGITDKRISRMDDVHRKDIEKMDAKWERLFSLFVAQLQENKKQGYPEIK